MPEGPEVETIVRGLQCVCGDQIDHIDVSKSKGLIKNAPAEIFARSLVGRLVEKISRRGKWIRLDLSDGLVGKPSVLVHLGMYGSFLINRKPAHERVAIQLVSGSVLFYSDMRSWGRWYLFSVKEADQFLGSRVGVEATQITSKKLGALLRSYRGTVASFLMDQSRLAGIGNIYRSEILWHSRILPDRPTTDLEESEVEVLTDKTRDVLERAIRNRGSSISDYVDTSGVKGRFQNLHHVYGKSETRCARQDCAGVIRSEDMDGRKVYYCRLCQK